MDKKRIAFAGKRDKLMKVQPREKEKVTDQFFAINSPSQKNEHSSYDRESNILPLNSGKNNRYPKKKKVIRPIILAGVSAVLIGAVLGFVMLNMFAQLEEPPLNSTANIDSIQKEDDTKPNSTKPAGEELTTMSLDEIQGFVLQAGVFSTQENADSWSSSFNSHGFPTMIWERDQQYFLLAGVAQTREKAEEIALEFEQYDLEIFIKEWSTPGAELQVTPQEQEWLRSFKELWNTSLTSAAEQGVIPIKGWEELISSIPEGNETFSSFKKVINDIQHDGEHVKGMEVNGILLSIWRAYDELGAEND